MIIPAGERRDVGTGIALAIPRGYAGFVQPRSGLAVQARHHGGELTRADRRRLPGRGAGVALQLRRASRSSCAVGERIAQLVVQRVEEPDFVAADELPETSRGEGGFGSSGR